MNASELQLNELLALVCEELDLTPSERDNAKNKYETVTRQLGGPGSNLAPYFPEMYPQGSFTLGTEVRPWNDDDEYDLDMVCELLKPPPNITPE